MLTVHAAHDVVVFRSSATIGSAGTITACMSAKLPDAQVSARSNCPGLERVTGAGPPSRRARPNGFVLYATYRKAGTLPSGSCPPPPHHPDGAVPVPGERRRDPGRRRPAAVGGGLHAAVDGGRGGRRRGEQADPLPPLRVEGGAGGRGVHARSGWAPPRACQAISAPTWSPSSATSASPWPAPACRWWACAWRRRSSPGPDRGAPRPQPAPGPAAPARRPAPPRGTAASSATTPTSRPPSRWPSAPTTPTTSRASPSPTAGRSASPTPSCGA